MATIHRREHSPNYFCSFKDASGTWRLRSTGTAERRAAQRICEGWQEAEELAHSGELTRGRILDLYNETLRRVGLQELKTHSIGEWLTQWLGGRTNLSQASRVAYDQAVREFLSYLGAAGSRRKLETITEPDINGFVEHLLKEGRSPGTVTKLVRKYLNGAFEKARKQGKIRYNPISATDPLQHEGIVKQTFRPEQITQLLAAADNDWRGAILFAYGSGARLQDVANLQWSSLDLENGVATFTERKGKRLKKKPIVVGLHPDFSDWLATQQVPARGEAPVFPSLASRTGAGRNGLSRAFEYLMNRAGVESAVLKTGSGEKGRSIRALSFHSFRHGAASAVFNSEAIRELQRRITGHSARSGVLERYTHADLETIRQAVAAIPRLPKTGVQS
jgi:integrase